MMHRSVAARLVVAAFVLSAGSTVVKAQIVEVPTFQVGSGVFGGHLQDVDVAAGEDGSFVVIWGDYSLTNISGRADHAATRRFSANGTPIGSISMVDTSAHVFNPTISYDGNGGYVAAWQWTGNEYLFFGQLLDAGGARLGNDFEVTLNIPGWPIVQGRAVGTAAGPTYLWNEAGALWARTIDEGRNRIGGDTTVDRSSGYRIDAAQTPDGGFFAVWSAPGVSLSKGRIFGPNGHPRGDAFEVSAVFGSPQAAASPDGTLAVVGPAWDGATTISVNARWFDADGTPLSDEVVVETLPPGPSAYVDAEFDARGNLYVLWTEYDNGQATPPRVRIFDTDRVPHGAPVVISDEGGVEPKVVRLQNGNIANVWYWGGKAWATITKVCEPSLSACGDGVYAPACEQCDDGQANSDVTPDACRSDCSKPACGDGVTDTGEQCDDGNRESCDGCSPRCQTEIGFSCGDGARAYACGETCDDGQANSDVTPDACRSDCSEPRCGDGVTDTTEQCDDGNTVSCDGCSFDCRVESTLPDANANGIADVCEDCALLTGGFTSACAPRSVDGLTPDQEARFAVGIEEFTEVETPASGLGPVFNGASCAECHNSPMVGGSGDRRVTRIGTTPPSGSGFDPLVELGGSLLQDQGIVTAACSVAGEVVPPEATIVGQRDTPALFGVGLIEAIPELAIRLRADTIDKNNDGISGRYNTINNRVGRFGWKAQVPSLHDFAVEAYVDEMGITTPHAPLENLPQGGPLVCDEEPDPEDDGSSITAFAEFLQLLAPPPGLDRRDLPREQRRDAGRGKRIFRRLKCQKCHYDRYRAREFPVAAVQSRRRIPLYSDLLLHDMGPGLADGIKQGSASGSEFRTAPLWGVRYSAPYLHDGRAATLDEAIVAHGGEASLARSGYVALSAKDRQALVEFLKTL